MESFHPTHTARKRSAGGNNHDGDSSRANSHWCNLWACASQSQDLSSWPEHLHVLRSLVPPLNLHSVEGRDSHVQHDTKSGRTARTPENDLKKGTRDQDSRRSSDAAGRNAQDFSRQALTSKGPVVPETRPLSVLAPEPCSRGKPKHYLLFRLTNKNHSDSSSFCLFFSTVSSVLPWYQSKPPEHRRSVWAQ